MSTRLNPLLFVKPAVNFLMFISTYLYYNKDVYTPD
jgi:hypothetical protein